MDVVSVACNHCGAPLEVGETSRFVTCQYCKSSLEVKRTASTIYTEVLERIDQRTEQIAEDVKALRESQEAEDREKAVSAEVARRIVRSAGQVTAGARIGMAIGATLFGGIFCAFGLFAVTGGGDPHTPWIFRVVGGFFGLIGVLIVVGGIVAAARGTGATEQPANEPATSGE